MSFLCITASYYSEGVEVQDLATGAAHVVIYSIDITASYHYLLLVHYIVLFGGRRGARPRRRRGTRDYVEY